MMTNLSSLFFPLRADIAFQSTQGAKTKCYCPWNFFHLNRIGFLPVPYADLDLKRSFKLAVLARRSSPYVRDCVNLEKSDRIRTHLIFHRYNIAIVFIH